MTTAQYVSWLSKRIAGNLFSRQDLVDAINQAQNEILGRDLLCMAVRPDAYLHTTAGTYVYAASTFLFDSIDGTTQYDIRKVSKIYTFQASQSPIYAYGGLNKTSHRPEHMLNPMASDETVIPSDCTQQSLIPGAADCIIKLWRENNPGTTTQVYLAEAYRWPTQVTSESVAMSIPEQFQRGLLKYAILKDLEYTEYGSADHPEEGYRRELARFDSLYANKGAKSDLTGTPPREC